MGNEGYSRSSSSSSSAVSPGGGGEVEEEKKKEAGDTLELSLCSDVMAAERDSSSGSKGTESGGDEEKRRGFYCKYCNKKFGNSQALGGHQNAHKRERGSTKKEKVEEEALAQIVSHLYPYSSFVPYNHHRLYGSYSKSPLGLGLGVHPHSLIAKPPLHSWQPPGLTPGYGYGYAGLGLPPTNRPRQPTMAAGTTNPYWGPTGVAGGFSGFQQPPPAQATRQHFNIAEHPPPAPTTASHTGGFNLGGTGTAPFLQGSSLQIGSARSVDNRLAGSAECRPAAAAAAVSENRRQEVRGLDKVEEEARVIDLTLRL